MGSGATPLFVEVCAGTAALSLALHGEGARPPVSRMGAKTGYSAAILGAMGLRSGAGAERYLWAEADRGVRLLLAAYADPGLRAGAVEVLRGWLDEDQRDLWGRLREEGPVRDGSPTAREFARWARIVTANRLICVGPDWMNTGKGGSTFGGTEFCTRLEALIKAVAGMATLPASVVTDAAAGPPDVVPPGSVVVIDPPYVGTCPYAHDLPRAEVVRVARAWAAKGARVAVCEAEAIGELVAEGWETAEITAMKVGHRRSFSRQQVEMLTLSQPPPMGWNGRGQLGLFGGAG
jgi:hypothetical protein